MTGIVDEALRALLDVTLWASPAGEKRTITAWVDTAFNGGLVLPVETIESLGLKSNFSISATLADGNTVQPPTYTCYLDWFGEQYRTQVVANEGQHPLLGTTLLSGRKLLIDYEEKTLELL